MSNRARCLRTGRTVGDAAGFTLAEVLMATVIMLIVAMGVITALIFAARATSVTAERTRALNLASQYIERARNLDYDLVGTYADGVVYGDPPGSIHTPDTPTTMWDQTHPAPTFGTGFTVVTKVSWQRSIAGRAQYKNMEVRVSWTSPMAGSVNLTTSIFGKTDLTNSGDLELVLRDRATNAPITGLSVSVTPQGATVARTVTTDANGTAFFGMVPTGVASMTISTTDWVFDTSKLSDVPVINVATGDVLSSFTILGQKASSLQVHVVGTHGDGLPGAAVSLVVMGSSRSGTTDSGGYVIFGAVPPGVFSVTAAASGRQTVVASITVPTPTSPGQVVTVSIALHDPIWIRYKVTGTDTSDVKAGATVTLYTQAGVALASAATDSGGLATFSTLDTGAYYATALLAGAQGRYPAASATYTTVSASDYGNHDTPIGYATGGLIIRLIPQSIIRVNVTGSGGGTFPYAAQITVDGVSHNAVGGTWDFIASQVRPYSVQATYAGYRPFGGAVVVSGYGQVFPVTALLDSLSNMTVEVRGAWGGALLYGATVSVAGPRNDSISAPSGTASFTAAQGHALYGTNQPGDSLYTITATRSGYRDGSRTGVSLVPGQTLSPNPVVYLATTRIGTFVITTRKNSNGSVRGGATIQVTGPSSSPDGISSYSSTFTSDSNGAITITNLPLGTYTFKYQSGSNYNSVVTPTSKALTTDGQTQTFDVKW